MAARLAPGSVSARHQYLLHFVGQSRCKAEAILSPVRAFCSAAQHPRRRTDVMIAILYPVAGIDLGGFLFLIRGYALSGN